MTTLNIKNKVLIVDDSTFMRMVLKDILLKNRPDLEILEADGEGSALLELNKNAPDLVLLDIVMNSSELEGLKILEIIHTHYPRVNVIMITSIGHANIKKQCAQLGAKGYIQKPFDADEISTEINKYL